MHKGQGRKPLLNARDHRAVIATWAQEYFEKRHCYSTLSTAASRNATWSCIMQRGRYLLMLCRNSAKISGSEVIGDGPKDSGNVFSSQTSPHFSLFFRNVGFYVPKMKKTIQTVTNEKCKNQPLCWYRGTSVPIGDLHICEGTIDAEADVGIWRDICCHQNDNFSQEPHCKAQFILLYDSQFL